MARVHLQTLGCRLNLAESERMARTLRMDGHEVVTHPDEADIRVVNTCTVTREAAADSRRAARSRSDTQKVVVTGCHSELHPEDFATADLIISNEEKERVASLLRERFGLEGLALGMDISSAPERALYPLATQTTRAFVKIQDGCNLRCSFCLTTLARGLSRSRPAPDIIQEIQNLSDQGCMEAVLTGVHAGSYGLDIHRDLGWLVDQILTHTSIPRLRLSSLEPWNFKEDWLTLWQKHSHRLCRHLHMSLQSNCASILKKIRRHYDPETFLERITAARRVGGMAITTDIIVGFPGETDEEHEASLAFVRQCSFAGAHIFSYSPRPGTDAATMPNHVAGTTKKQRYDSMRAVVADTSNQFAASFDNTTLHVLWENGVQNGQRQGLTDNYLRVTADPRNHAANSLEFIPVRWVAGELSALAPFQNLIK